MSSLRICTMQPVSGDGGRCNAGRYFSFTYAFHISPTRGCDNLKQSSMLLAKYVVGFMKYHRPQFSILAIWCYVLFGPIIPASLFEKLYITCLETR
ncbi:uncharacterized protein LY89DRAFT_204015 [Mollisia scopiformis]|uniref:Uncharacterized protein n=1 Tax=Mollisia scopiformis TaxID=149040 RepID=A0A194WWE3_MOLSC|nr:uncharacterized protein LY89DRAFT_204015 [Mollisia scopiformis]KUJ12270.1 hypothetical protein LY89DRAFT_204015 [Mollisia scopiformis]